MEAITKPSRPPTFMFAHRKLCLRVAVGAALVACIVSQVSAQWTVVNLHPAGATESMAYGVQGGQQAGYIRFFAGGPGRASLWSGSAASWVNMQPAGNESAAFAIGGGQQVGYAAEGGTTRASLWSGSAGTWQSLNPESASFSYAQGVNGGQQVGYAYIQSANATHGSLWSSTAASWIDLNPAGATYSQANGLQGGQQVGFAEFGGPAHAGMWTGTAASWVDLNPGTSGSQARAIYGGQQVGEATVGAVEHAGLWSGTSASWVDLHPTGARESVAYGVYGGQQVGFVTGADGVDRASLWSGSAASWIDLHALLPTNFNRSQARGVWNDGTYAYVVGWGNNTSSGHIEALMWVGRPCDMVSTASQPSNAAPVPGTTASFSIAANGTVTSYQWRHNGSPMVNGPRVSGSTAPTLTISSVQASDEGSYDCVVSSACNSVTSNTAVLSCDPMLLSQPQHRALLRPGIQLTVSVPAGTAYSYRWRQDGQNLFNISGLFSGVTTRTLTVLSEDPSLEGVYDVVVTDPCGAVTSSASNVRICFADFNDDGDTGTDADIESFFACLAGNCCPACGSADFNGDGDIGTDADIEAFFRVLAGGSC